MNEPTNFVTDNIGYKYDQAVQDDQAVPNLLCPHSGNDSEWDNPPYSTINAWVWGTQVSKLHSTIAVNGSPAWHRINNENQFLDQFVLQNSMYVCFNNEWKKSIL